ncbi:MAG TPA: TlpA disulfide reductase family protein [Polyangiaceae bacterium]|jgi:thiol-disulfide isomerase/thioredoxin
MKGSASLLTLALLLGCESAGKDTPIATEERSQAVVQKGPAPVVAAATMPVAAKLADAPKKPRVLCSRLEEPGRAFPKKSPSRVAAANEKSLPETLATANGKWTWVNFWAAWCAPCKEEIPRLLGWQSKLGNAPFRLQFVSLDDDERQLKDFLEAQPAGALRASYWLKEGKERDDFLHAADSGDDPALPFHWLVNPKGKIACVIGGAVEDADFDEVARLVGK